MSPDFTITGVSGNANFSVGSPQTFGDADNFDFLVTGSAVNTDTVDMSSFTSATPDVGAVRLFDLEFDIASSTTPATDYAFAFVEGASRTNLLGTSFLNNITGGICSPALRSDGGSFAVTAVPEPTSLALVGAAGLAGLVRLRRLKKRQAVAEKAQETAA